MPGTTPNGYPYPTGGDSIRDGDNTARALAEALPPRLVRQYNSSVAQNYTTSAAGGIEVTFPEPFADAFSVVTAWCTSADYAVQISKGIGNNGISNTGMVLRVFRITDGTTVNSTTVAIRWIAIGNILPA